LAAGSRRDESGGGHPQCGKRSVAIRDAIAAIAVPVIEVRLLNARTEDTIGHPSLIAAVCDGTISGFGTTGYGLALEAAMCLNRRPR
jgi:3-dehydroquinate dehydratase